MIQRITIAALLIAFVATEADAQNRKYRRRGVILGGLAGAALGAAIGDKGDNETAGALIGAAAGAVAGGTIGNQKDQRIEHNSRYHSPYSTSPYSASPYDSRFQQPQRIYRGQSPVPHYSQPHHYPPSPYAPSQRIYQPTPAITGQSVLVSPETVPPPASTQPIAPQDVVAMVNAGLSESIIIQQIQLRGVSHSLSVREIIQLHQSGVSEAVITEMQTPTEYEVRGQWQQ